MIRGAAGPLALLGAAIVGIILGERAGPAPAVGALTVALVAGASALFVRGHRLRLTVAFVAALLAGLALTQRALDGTTHSALTQPIAARATVSVRGALAEDPDGGPYWARVLLRVDGFDGGPPVVRTVLLSARGDAAARIRLLEAGDRITVTGWLEPLSGFDTRLRWRHTVGELHALELTAFDPPTSPVLNIANSLRARVLRGGTYLPTTERALVSGFLLGDTRALPPDVEEQFRAAGLTHLLAVSGANVAFVLALVAPLLRRLSLRWQLGGGLAVLVVFGTMTRWEPSVLRACVMAACSMIGLYLGRPSVGVRTLALAALVLLVADPFLLHSVGFLLSVGASAGIVLFAAGIGAHLPGPRFLRETLAITLAAQIGVAPVLIPVFGSVPLAAVPANLLAVPLAAPLTIWGLVSGVAGGVVEPYWPGLAATLQVPTRILADLLLWIAAAFARFTPAVDARAAWGIVAVASLAAAARRRRNLRRDVAVPPR